MEPRPNDMKAIRILYTALLVGQMLFALIVTVQVETGMLSNGINSLTPVLINSLQLNSSEQSSLGMD